MTTRLWRALLRLPIPGRTNGPHPARDPANRRWSAGTGGPRWIARSYFPEWLLERRRRSEQALINVVATSYLLGVSTRRVEKLAETLITKSLSKSQVSQLTKNLDQAIEQFRSRPLDTWRTGLCRPTY
jgi:hypothetical protein